MPREKEGYPEQYRSLLERFPGREAISINESAALVGVDRRTLISDRTFPKKKIGRIYVVPLVKLASWMC